MTDSPTNFPGGLGGDAPLACPIDGCDGRIEANPSLYLAIDADGTISVYGIQHDDVYLTCDDNEHDVTERYPALRDAVLKYIDGLENLLT